MHDQGVLLAFAAFLLVVVLGLVVLIDHWKGWQARLRQDANAAGAGPKNGTAWIYAGVCFLLALVVARSSQGTAAAAWSIGLMLLGLFFMLARRTAAGLLPGFPIRSRTSVPTPRQPRGQGPADDEIARLRRDIESQGATAPRLNQLGCLQLERQQWADAYQTFLQCEELTGFGGQFLSNQAVALWRMGRLEEASALLDRAEQSQPPAPVTLLNHCQILTELGRLDAARERLRRAEDAEAHAVAVGTPARAALDALFRDCRERLEEASSA